MNIICEFEKLNLKYKSYDYYIGENDIARYEFTLNCEDHIFENKEEIIALLYNNCDIDTNLDINNPNIDTDSFYDFF